MFDNFFLISVLLLNQLIVTVCSTEYLSLILHSGTLNAYTYQSVLVKKAKFNYQYFQQEQNKNNFFF